MCEHIPTTAVVLKVGGVASAHQRGAKRGCEMRRTQHDVEAQLPNSFGTKAELAVISEEGTRRPKARTSRD